MDFLVLKHFDSGEMLVIDSSQIVVFVGEPVDSRSRTHIEIAGDRCPVIVSQSPTEILSLLETGPRVATVPGKRWLDLLERSREAIDACGGGGNDRDVAVGLMVPTVEFLEAEREGEKR